MLLAAALLLPVTRGVCQEPGDSGESATDLEAATEELSELSAAFRRVARAVKPSVVQVSVKVRPSAGGQVPGRRFRYFGPGEVPEDFFREFRRFFDELPEEGRPFGPMPFGMPEDEEEDSGQNNEQGKQEEEEEPGYNVPFQMGAASGWIYDDQGHVLTNHHVISKADVITLRFYDKTEAEAEVVGSDPQTDIAVLQVDKAGLKPARLANGTVEQGDIVMAIGSPFEYAFSVSQGIVSARERRMGILGPKGYESFIQTDAAINPGNSGGPLVNGRGEVVGMNTAIATRTGTFAGIGFAIPAEMICEVADQLIRTGKVRRGYLGAYISDRPEMLKSFGVEKGVLIEDVMEDAPADRAGLKPGDVVLELDGDAMQSAREFRRMIAAADPGSTVSLTILRDGEKKTLRVKLGEQPREETVSRRQPGGSEEQPARYEVLDKVGLEQVETMTTDLAEEHDIEHEPGVLVLEVGRFSAAAAAGIRPGTIISQVSGQKVTRVDDLATELEKHDLEGGVRLRIRMPDGRSRFTMLTLEP
jgi:serine protease Do